MNKILNTPVKPGYYWVEKGSKFFIKNIHGNESWHGVEKTDIYHFYEYENCLCFQKYKITNFEGRFIKIQQPGFKE